MDVNKKRSIHTIAKELGISSTTISFVINGKAESRRISNSVIKRVKDHLDKVGYRPNMIAQSLRTGKTNIIGMLVEDISDPFFSAIARGIEMGIENSGYRIFYLTTKNKLSNAVSILNVLKGSGVDAFIVAPTPGLETEIELLAASDKPVVLFDRYFPELSTCNVVVDNIGGAYEGVLELNRNGYQKIAFVTLVSDLVQMLQRKEGYLKASCDAKKEYRTILEIPYNLDESEISALIKEFLLTHNEVDAILFATNYLAIAGLDALKGLGLIPGKDIGIIGFDDNSHFSLFSPSITAIAQPVSDIAKVIVEQLMDALNSDSLCKPQTIQLPVEIIKRESSSKNVC